MMQTNEEMISQISDRILKGCREPVLSDGTTMEQSYLIRDCYKVYFRYICEILKEGYKQVTVTGTPGIGKSIFLLYFFKRFREENPHVTIVTAAFTRIDTLLTCMVYEPGCAKGEVYDYVPFLEDCLYVYDGTPPSHAVRERMITFTAPRRTFFESIEEADAHTFLYMPMWTLDELNNAVCILGKDISDDILRERFEKFGGVARYCLTRNEGLYSRGLGLLARAAYQVTSYATMLESIRGRLGREDISYEVFHLIPILSDKAPFASLCTRAIGSKFVEEILACCIKRDGTEIALRRWLELVSPSPELGDWVVNHARNQ